MSKVKIEGNASGTATITLTTPNSNTDRTATLPDADGELLNSGSTLSSSNLSGALPAIDGSSLTGLTTSQVDKALGSFSNDTANSTLGTSFAAVTIDTTNKNTTEFSLSSNQVTVNKTGTFLVMYRITTDVTSGTARSESEAALFEGGTEVQGTRSGMYNRTAGKGLATGCAQTILDITSGDVFDVRALKTGTDTVVQTDNGTNLTFVEL